ncbi:MAG: hypothetical protein OXS29_00640 [bacterium]|nr:hypothetical protein [bacterium]MDE0438755.1 hypothetical protein [bacterium]
MKSAPNGVGRDGHVPVTPPGAAVMSLAGTIVFGNPTREWVGYLLWVVGGGTLVTLLVVRTLDGSV